MLLNALGELLSSGMVALWLGATIVFCVVEGVLPGLVSIWFAIGSLAAMIAAAMHAPFWLQCIVFVIVSAATLAATRPLAAKYINSKAQATNADMIIGQKVVVSETIDNIHNKGTAEAAGKIWSARSSDGRIIESGKVVTVLRIEGVKIIVSED